MKAKILAMLRETDGYVSGQELCNQFGVSRTAVWKAINQLKAAGYQIEAAQNKGYHLKEAADVMNEKNCDGMHMLVEATNKTSENTFIRDKLHLARNELNGDLNIYERMIEKQERGIGKEIEFVNENKENEEKKENPYECELEEDLV